MENSIRPYSWGSRTAIAGLLGEPVPSPEPQAELWAGAHAAAPSHLVGAGSLPDHIAADPPGVLGAAAAREFGDRLPFLLKLLAADSALSLQAHPTLDQARAGFEAENAAGIPLDAPSRNYKDRSHKPELVCALTDFEALCGFRPTATTVRLLDELDTPDLGDVRAALVERPGEAGLREVVTALLADRAGVAPLVDAVADACRAAVVRAPEPEFRAEYAMAGRLAEHYPGDPGVLIALLMNRILLAPGEAVFLPAGNMHAYLSGFAVEIMANSDNVLRGGLTAKHIDVQELTSIVRFAPDTPAVIPSVPVARCEAAYRAPAVEFALSRIRVGGVGRVVEHAGAQILLVVDGQVAVSDAHGRTLTVTAGRSVFLPASQGPVRVTGKGTVFRARDGLDSGVLRP